MSGVEEIAKRIFDIIESTVGDLVSIVWAWTFGSLIHLILLKHNLNTLDERMKELETIIDNIESEFEKELCYNPRMTRTSNLQIWMDNVYHLESKVLEMKRSYEATRMMCYAQVLSMLHRLFTLGDQVAKLKQRVEKVKNEKGQLGESIFKKSPELEAIEFLPNTTDFIFDRENILSDIYKHISDPRVSRIGIYGMGGVGKTTLLLKINNDLWGKNESNDALVMMFELAIWVKVSPKWSVERVQDDIFQRLQLGIPRSKASSSHRMNQKARILRKFLSEKRFLLIFDDMWKKLNLDDLGIPLHFFDKKRCKSKVVFTTRDGKVCREMRCDRTIYIPILDKIQSWDLLCMVMKSNSDLNHPTTRPLAKKLVSWCAGLPIVIDAIVDLVAENNTYDDWKGTIMKLEKSDNMFASMKDKDGKPILSRLKTSFDQLERKRLQLCLLYFCLYPKGFSIYKERVIEQWLCEGLLEEETTEEVEGDQHPTHAIDFDMLKIEGNRIIQRLKDACLLEGVKDECDDEWGVRMHDLVHDMARWITSTEDIDGMGKMLIQTNKSINGDVEITNAIRRVSLMNSKVGAPIKIPSSCPQLKTLMLRYSKMQNWQALDSLLPSCCSLITLDLTNCVIEEVPKSISCLANLRYLNLSGTKIRSLRAEVGNLKKLKILDLGHTEYLVEISKEAVCNLTNLVKLNLFWAAYRWDTNLSLIDLEKLSRLQDLRMNLYTIEELNGCKRMSFESIIKELHLDTMPAVTSDKLSDVVEEMKKLEHLQLSNLESLDGSWQIQRCGSGSLSNLKKLNIFGCKKLNSVTGICTLPVLGSARSPALRKISRCELFWPSLRELKVLWCQNVTVLPFGTRSAPHMKLIEGKRDWWDKLSWESEDTKVKFAHCFKVWP